jgi:hypothetical protein
MSEKNNGGPAFPVPLAAGEAYNPSMMGPGDGMSLRDYFAANAPIGVADANDVFYRENGRNARQSEMLKTLADLRGRYADAMLAERAK